MEFRKRERDDPRFQIAPLVDILFLLIIFFTVTTTFATSGGINVSLPESSSRQPLKKADKLFVVIGKEGKAYVEGQRVSDASLRARFKKAKAADAETIIVIQADRATSHGRVVAVMDMAKEAKLDRIAIAVEQKPTPPPEEENDKP